MKPKTVSSLKRKLDIVRREYIRKRDAPNGIAKCISCPQIKRIEELQVGHYYKRQHDWTTLLGADERNVNLQCEQCNKYRYGNSQGYALGLIRKYGEGILDELEEEKRTNKYWGIKAMQEVIAKYSALA